MDAFTETLHSWSNFYLLIGTAAATLAGLMFVALSLAMNVITDITSEMFDLFITPTILYLASALMLAATMLVPVFTPLTLALALFLLGVVGMWITVAYVRSLIAVGRTRGDFHWSDWIGEVILPLVSYPLILAAALFFALSRETLALGVLAFAPVTLLMSGIGNAWSVVMASATRHAENQNRMVGSGTVNWREVFQGLVDAG